MLVTLFVPHPMVKLVGLVIVNCGTPTEAVTCTDFELQHPVMLSQSLIQYTPGDPGAKILMLPWAGPTGIVFVPTIWSHCVVIFRVGLDVAVNVPAFVLQVMFITVGLTATVGEVKFW
jgi:hypothetical protein